MARIRTRFGPRTTADEVVAGVDLHGRRAVVTGGASGIGIETARSLARAGADVTLAVRRTADGEEVARDIVATTGNSDVHVRHLDLADQASVHRFAADWTGPLHLLVDNAGVMAVPELTRTPEGWEMQFAVNHLGHFALALGLHDALARAGGARIVAVSSSGHTASPVVFDDVHYERREYDPWSAYGQSKTANVLFAVEATRRWSGDGVVANAVMPGGIMTELQRHIPDEMREQWAQVPGKTPQQGAATSLVAAVAPELEGVGGRYLENGNEAEVIPDDQDRSGEAEDGMTGLSDWGVKAWALDPAAAQRLWQVSRDMVGAR